ncbi:hypothetical protein ACTXT7_008104, partial [Hymenolepis weldensis]
MRMHAEVGSESNIISKFVCRHPLSEHAAARRPNDILDRVNCHACCQGKVTAPGWDLVVQDIGEAKSNIFVPQKLHTYKDVQRGRGLKLDDESYKEICSRISKNQVKLKAMHKREIIFMHSQCHRLVGFTTLTRLIESRALEQAGKY